MLNTICDYVEKNGIKGPIYIFVGWLILFLLAVELRSKTAEFLLPLVAILLVVYLAIATFVLLRGTNGEGEEKTNKQATDKDQQEVSGGSGD